MVKQILNNRENTTFINSTSSSQTCTCLICGGCIGCLIFAPIVGLILSGALAGSLEINKDSAS